VSPLEIIDKSGAVAAMREHGLPIIIMRFISCDLTSRCAMPPDVICLDDHFQRNLMSAKRSTHGDSLPKVANSFLSALSAAG
jgi:aspartate 1-decarboxylase